MSEGWDRPPPGQWGTPPGQWGPPAGQSAPTAPPPPGQWAPPPPPPGPPGWGQYGQYPPPAFQQRTEPLSTVSLVLGIASFFVCWVIGGIAAIITGSRAKKAIDASGGTKGGRSSAVAGQVLGWINVAVGVGLGILIAVIAVFASHHQSYTSLEPGDCFNRNAGILSMSVSKVSCNGPHQQEVVGTFEAPNGSWPGASGIQALAQPQCSTFAQQYVGAPIAGVQLVWIYPGRQSWNDGTRTVVCSVRNADGTKRRGSLRGGLGSTTTG